MSSTDKESSSEFRFADEGEEPLSPPRSKELEIARWLMYAQGAALVILIVLALTGVTRPMMGGGGGQGGPAATQQQGEGSQQENGATTGQQQFGPGGSSMTAEERAQLARRIGIIARGAGVTIFGVLAGLFLWIGTRLPNGRGRIGATVLEGIVLLPFVLGLLFGNFPSNPAAIAFWGAAAAVIVLVFTPGATRVARSVRA